jgi:catechol 2,3-dioxygenase-like lactoylglutathione lyase family enzyme
MHGTFGGCEWHHTGIVVPDVDEAVAFWTGSFGYEPSSRPAT